MARSKACSGSSPPAWFCSALSIWWLLQPAYHGESCLRSRLARNQHENLRAAGGRQPRESSERYRRGRRHDGARVTRRHCCVREVVRENRLNQCGSVALSMEAMPRAAGVAILLIKWRCRSTVQTTNQKLVSANPARRWSVNTIVLCRLSGIPLESLGPMMPCSHRAHLKL